VARATLAVKAQNGQAHWQAQPSPLWGEEEKVKGNDMMAILVGRVAVPTNKEERVSDACESVSRQVTD